MSEIDRAYDAATLDASKAIPGWGTLARPTPAASTDPAPECVGCPPCLGRGNDGHGLTHCAECCFGTGVEAEPGCPVHYPLPATSDAGGVQAGGAEGLSDIEALEANVTISALMAGRISGPQAVAAINGRATGIVSAAATRARAEGAAGVRDDIQARRRLFRSLNADPQYLLALDDAYGLANNRARSQS